MVLIPLNSGPIQVSAGATLTWLRNYVYFKENDDPTSKEKVKPYQSGGNQFVVSPEAKMSVEFIRHVFFKPRIIFTEVLGDDNGVLSIPSWFINAQLTYENELFNHHLQLQAGVDAHWQTAYHALGYDIPIQQFYIQSAEVSPAFPLVDVFFTGKMRRARFFFKYHNLVQIATNMGYLPTPGYPGQRNLLDFGFEFLLFD